MYIYVYIYIYICIHTHPYTYILYIYIFLQRERERDNDNDNVERTADRRAEDRRGPEGDRENEKDNNNNNSNTNNDNNHNIRGLQKGGTQHNKASKPTSHSAWLKLVCARCNKQELQRSSPPRFQIVAIIIIIIISSSSSSSSSSSIIHIYIYIYICIYMYICIIPPPSRPPKVSAMFAAARGLITSIIQITTMILIMIMIMIIYIYIYIYICIHMCIYIYIYTHTVLICTLMITRLLLVMQVDSTLAKSRGERRCSLPTRRVRRAGRDTADPRSKDPDFGGFIV